MSGFFSATRFLSLSKKSNEKGNTNGVYLKCQRNIQIFPRANPSSRCLDSKKHTGCVTQWSWSLSWSKFRSPTEIMGVHLVIFYGLYSWSITMKNHQFSKHRSQANPSHDPNWGHPKRPWSFFGIPGFGDWLKKPLWKVTAVERTGCIFYKHLFNSPKKKIPLPFNWLALGDELNEQPRWPFSLLNNEQKSNWLRVEHLFS